MSSKAFLAADNAAIAYRLIGGNTVSAI